MNDGALRSLLANRPAFEPGTVWLVGAGPGDPGHLTVDALAALDQADVILHDALIDPRVLELAGHQARLIRTGKRGGQPSISQTRIAEMLIQSARDGHRVLRLKGGDPMVFGRGGEEMLALAEAGIRFRIVPGVTAGLAALAAASIPATHRAINQAVIFATGHAADGTSPVDWAAFAALGQPIVLYMALRGIETIAASLMEGGLAGGTPVAVIASATQPGQEMVVSTLGAAARDIRQAGIEPPAIVVVGEIVSIPGRLARLAPVFAEALS